MIIWLHSEHKSYSLCCWCEGRSSFRRPDMVGCSKIFTPQSKYSSIDGTVCLACCNQVHSHVAFNECFLSLNGEDWVNRCDRGHLDRNSLWMGPLLSRTPFSGDRNSLWFCTLVKVNTPSPPPSLASIYHSRVTIGPALLQNGALFRGQPTRCLLIQGFLLFVFNPVWTFSKGDAEASKMCCLSLILSGDPQTGIRLPPRGL